MEYDALDAARRFAASGLAWCWLDGEAAAAGERRVSYLGVASSVRIAETGHELQFLDQLGGQRADRTGGFSSGWVAALGYEFGVSLMGLDPHPDTEAAGFALRLDAVLAIDHAAGTSQISGETPAVNTLRAVLERPVRDAAESFAATSAPRWRSSGDEYVEHVHACREAIHRGDAYVLCLTDTATVTLDRMDPLAVYERLRDGGAATRGAVISMPGRALVSASPERFLTVRGRTVSTHPIKGTRPRDADREQDAAYAADLVGDPKERAENLMIVDLMRNDLSRVCEPGSVRVERFLAVETHAHVHQLVSTVSGRMRSGLDMRDAIRVAFPGGSMTGAPKHRAVSILRGLEHGTRGLYSGCFGWMDDSGDAELAMTIRGVELRERADGSACALVGAGGGITADSDARQELAEKALKARSVFAALRAEEPDEAR